MKTLLFFTTIVAFAPLALADDKKVGVGAKPIKGAEVIIDGSRKMLDEMNAER